MADPTIRRTITRMVTNILLALGHIGGLLLVWVGIELVAFDASRFGAGLLGIGLGVAWWAGLVVLSRGGAGPLPPAREHGR